ncbi:MAG: hypothetical protein ACLP7Q_01260 [Isosphaeraceae bacterium]
MNQLSPHPTTTVARCKRVVANCAQGVARAALAAAVAALHWGITARSHRNKAYVYFRRSVTSELRNITGT